MSNKAATTAQVNYPAWVKMDKNAAAASATYSGPATGVTSGVGSHAKNSRMLNRAISASTRQPVHATQEARTVALKDGTEKTASSAKGKKDNNDNENYSDGK